MASPWQRSFKRERGVRLEFFRVDQRVEKVDGEQDADCETDDRFDHGANSYSRSQATA
jgi:hypothetical protein